MYTESDMLQHLYRLAEIFIESYPEKREEVETFIRWIYNQWGYKYPPQL
jgi:hypothetical protein